MAGQRLSNGARIQECPSTARDSDANVVGITPAFDPVSLHLRQVEDGIPLCASNSSWQSYVGPLLPVFMAGSPTMRDGNSPYSFRRRQVRV